MQVLGHVVFIQNPEINQFYWDPWLRKRGLDFDWPASSFWWAAMVRLTVLPPAAGIVTLDTVTVGAAAADTVFISVAADGAAAAAVLLTTDWICTPSSNCCLHSHTDRTWRKIHTTGPLTHNTGRGVGAFRALTLLVWRQEEHPACKN